MCPAILGAVDFLQNALKALPAVATSPYAFLGYIALVLAWLFVRSRTDRLKTLMGKLADIPEPARPGIVQAELGSPVPPELSSEQWIRAKINSYKFYGFLALCGLVILILALAIWKTSSSEGDLQIDRVDPLKKSSLNDLSSVYRDTFSYNGPIRSVSQSREQLMLVSDASTSQKDGSAELDPLPGATKSHEYAFDITLRNPSDRPVTVNDVRIVFDPNEGRGPQNVQEVSGTYLVVVDSNGATSKTPVGEFPAQAWYPYGKGTLIVVTPLSQSLPPRSTDRIRVAIRISPEFKLLGPMKKASLEIGWNGKKTVTSRLVDL